MTNYSSGLTGKQKGQALRLALFVLNCDINQLRDTNSQKKHSQFENHT